MFVKLGQLVCARWGVVIVAWAMLLAAMLAWAPRLADVRTHDDASLLPDDVPSRIAIDAMHRDFDKPPAMSVAAIVVERPEGLTGSARWPEADDAQTDFGFLRRLTQGLQALPRSAHWEIFSPVDPVHAYLPANLLSQERTCQAAVIKIDLPTNFVSTDAVADVEEIEQTIRDAAPPAGLDWAITGSASYGRDYFTATETSLDRTTWVAVAAVIVVLLLTYRALLAALISLVTVSLAVAVSLSILAIGGYYGWAVSMVVELFTIVIGYGAGVDFSLFFLSRYHEELSRGELDGAGRRDALVRALRGTGPAIVASAGTVAVGLGLMCLARFKAFSSAGPAVAISVVVSCVGSLTLAPALAFLAGRRAFWPRRIQRDHRTDDAPRGFWHRLAGFTVARPVTILLIGLAVLAPLALYGSRQEVVFDTLADLPPSNQAVRGAEMFTRHFPQGEMAPVRFLVQLDRPLSDGDWLDVATAVDKALGHWPQDDAPHADLQAVRSLAHPLGLDGTVSLDRSLVEPSGDSPLDWPVLQIIGEGFRRMSLAKFDELVRPRHLAADGRAARWDIAINAPSYSNLAMNTLAPLAERVRQAVRSVPATTDAQPRILIAGDTAQMRDVKAVTQRDFRVVGGAVVAAILLVVLLLVRDVPTALFVMFATILTYGAALGLTAWLFGLAFGIGGPDWKVEFFLFVILVAVGQDYNLFMLRRIAEERRSRPLRPATHLAIARTGAIISCCGLIMAATLGSLASSPLRLLQELGVAFVIGLLIDTFLVRPLMVPAFVLRLRRMDRGKIETRPPRPEA